MIQVIDILRVPAWYDRADCPGEYDGLTDAEYLNHDPEDECDNEDRDQVDFADDEENYRLIDNDDSAYEYYTQP